jgi:hypothetical protein
LELFLALELLEEILGKYEFMIVLDKQYGRVKKCGVKDTGVDPYCFVPFGFASPHSTTSVRVACLSIQPEKAIYTNKCILPIMMKHHPSKSLTLYFHRHGPQPVGRKQPHLMKR